MPNLNSYKKEFADGWYTIRKFFFYEETRSLKVTTAPQGKPLHTDRDKHSLASLGRFLFGNGQASGDIEHPKNSNHQQYTHRNLLSNISESPGLTVLQNLGLLQCAMFQ
jgi:hypothetical protein